ncbi:EthD domain-containing protein [Streptomyces mirabilis]|uniref:EthD domain-containing protein n=1 Tax=Streptomyces mirabilis TaxID=68239 RepID=UPI0033C1ECC2
MIKMVGIFKKKEGMSDEEFREYYENVHCPLFNEYLKKPGVERWTRRYLTPIAPPITGEVADSGFDVIVEIWCDETFYKSFFVDPMPAEFRAMVVEDEKNLFDRDHMYMYLADEYDTDLSTL